MLQLNNLLVTPLRTRRAPPATTLNNIELSFQQKGLRRSQQFSQQYTILLLPIMLAVRTKCLKTPVTYFDRSYPLWQTSQGHTYEHDSPRTLPRTTIKHGYYTWLSDPYDSNNFMMGSADKANIQRGRTIEQCSH